MEFATSETMKKLVEFASKIQEAASIDHVSPIKRKRRRYNRNLKFRNKIKSEKINNIA